MPSVPSLSVVMPLYNNAEYFPQALESVLGQSFGDFECIVIDDASQDSSPALLRAYARKDKRLRAIFLKKNIGLMRVSQMGLEQARAPLVARMDSDDLSLSERFKRQIDFMKRHPEVGMVGCSYFRFKGDPDHKRLNVRLPSLARVSSQSFSYRVVSLKLCTASAVYRRELALAVGGYRSFLQARRGRQRLCIFRHARAGKGCQSSRHSLRLQKESCQHFCARTNMPCMQLILWENSALSTDATTFPIRSSKREPLARLPKALCLPSRVTAGRSCNRDPLWMTVVMWVWLRRRHVSLLPRLFLYWRLLRGCLRWKIGLASLGAAIAEVRDAGGKRPC